MRAHSFEPRELCSASSYNELICQSPQNLKLAIEAGVRSLVKDTHELQFEILLGGFSGSKLYTFSVGSEKYVLRVIDPKRLDNPLPTLDKRKNEVIAHKMASDLGVAPEFIYSDSDALIIIMKFIEGHTLSKNDLGDKDVLQRLGRALRKIHDSRPSFPWNFTQLDRARKHYKRAKVKGIAFPSIFQKQYDQFEAEISGLGDETVFCHGDLNPANILVKDGQVYFIDWQKASFDHRYGDFGYFTLLSGMNSNESSIFLEAYLGRPPSYEELKMIDLAQQRASLLTSIVWFEFSESKEELQLPRQSRIERLDQALTSPNTKRGQEYIFSKETVNPLEEPSREVQKFGLAFLKEYLLRRGGAT